MTTNRRRTVWKFPLSVEARRLAFAQEIEMPEGATIVHVQEQENRPTMWVEVDPDKPLVSRYFTFVGTGKPEVEDNMTYLGTAHIGWQVYHVYEVVARRR